MTRSHCRSCSMGGVADHNFGFRVHKVVRPPMLPLTVLANVSLSLGEAFAFLHQRGFAIQLQTEVI